MYASVPRIRDGALALVGAAALIVDGLLRTGGDLTLAAYPLAVAAALPLAFLHRAPLAALLGIEAGAIACVVVFRPNWAAVAILMVALFYAALLGDRRRSVAVGAITGIALVATTFAVSHPFEVTNAVIRLLLFFGALALGDMVRSRTALHKAAAEKAQRQEREREEQGRQRVADDRLRIARDLHDTLAHSLVAINVRAGVAAHLQNPEDSSAALLDIKKASANALTDLRETLGLMREQNEPAPVVPVPDLSALPGLVSRVRGGGLKTGVEIDINGQVVPSPVGQAAFRIVQEALTNVMRHAGASSAHVLVGACSGALQIEVADDGRGGEGGAEGHGLRGMEERAEALGGSVVAGPRAEGGWRVRAELPLSRIGNA